MNPFDLTPEQTIGLHANIPKLQARRRIATRDMAGMEYQDIYNLYMLAYDDAEIAGRARLQFLQSFVKASCDAAAARQVS